MNLRDLEYFVAVAKHEHFGKAARDCHVSQPTLSGQIKKLEEFLGITLFERTNRRVILTPAGNDILNIAKQTLLRVQDIQDVAQSHSNPFAGQLRLGGIPTIATYLFPKIVEITTQKLPDLSLILTEEKTHILIEQLEKGEIDAALVALPIEFDKSFFNHKKLFEDPFYLAVSEHHELADRKEIKPSDLAHRRLLLLAEGHCLRGHALDACETVNIHTHNFMATSLETLRLMVKAGTGITIIPELAVPSNDSNIHYLPIKASSMKRDIGLVWRKTSAKKSIINTLIEDFF